MEDTFEAMRHFERQNHMSFFTKTHMEDLSLIVDMKLLEGQGYASVTWSLDGRYPIDGELTQKGLRLKEYLKNYEWS